MSAPPTQSDLNAAVSSPERQLLDAALALAPTISVDRVLQELVQQLRRLPGCEAVAIAIVDTENNRLDIARAEGFDIGGEELASDLRDLWREAVAESMAVVRVVDSARDLTVPMVSEDVRGAITMRVREPDRTMSFDELTRVVNTIASQAAGAIQRAQLVDRLAHHHRLEAIGEVSAGIAHELRTPLFGISSAAQLLRFRVRDDPVIERNVGRILREVERLNAVVSSLMEYARPAPLRLSVGDPDAIWHHVLASKRGLLESKALAVHHEPATPRAACDMDAEHMTQVFVHLLTNAVDAAPEGSDLTLMSAISPATGAWRSRLHNDGPPVPAEALPRVFDLFFSTKPGGAGVGLALCQRIVEEHRGTIALESTADSGTTVTISLPAHKSEAAVAPPDGLHG
jgi:signal transduction histidine kinase